MQLFIRQFMWAFQPHFRRGLERVANNVFAQVGFGLGARAYLIGFTEDADAPFPVCVEPETDPLADIDLSGVTDRGLRLYEHNPESDYIITSTRHHNRYHRQLADAMRAQALREALEGHELGTDRYFFIGASANVGAFEIHPVISVPRARWNATASLTRSRIDRYEVVPSLQASLIRELLRTATRDLQRLEPPENFSLEWTDRSEMIRKAAREFVQSVSLYSGYEFPSQLTVALDEVSAQPYEGRTGTGGLLLASEQNEHVETVMKFTEPIRLSDTRSLRKALEMADANHHLHCDGEKVTGLARLTAKYDPENENAFTFTIVARGNWELSHHDQPLLRVTNTRPTLPQPRLDGAHFTSVASRVFPEASRDDVVYLWSLVLGATDAAHGTMVVVHRGADAEAKRLLPQAQRVKPQRLDAGVLAAVTNIDGAVMVDVTGNCHAVGVILDGHARGSGDSSRGARYNSAVRYHAAQKGDCLVIIVSEDGMINLLPDLRRQVTRTSVEKVVARVEAVVGDDPVTDPDFEEFHRYWDHLEAVAFYLDQEQCDRANAARDRLEVARTEGGLTISGWTRMTVDPEMNDTYFVSEQ